MAKASFEFYGVNMRHAYDDVSIFTGITMRIDVPLVKESIVLKLRDMMSYIPYSIKNTKQGKCHFIFNRKDLYLRKNDYDQWMLCEYGIPHKTDGIFIPKLDAHLDKLIRVIETAINDGKIITWKFTSTQDVKL